MSQAAPWGRGIPALIRRLAVAVRGARIDGRAAVDQDMSERRPTVIGKHEMENRAQAGAGHDVGRAGAEADDARLPAVTEEVVAADTDGAGANVHLRPGPSGGVAGDERAAERDGPGQAMQAAAIGAGDVPGYEKAISVELRGIEVPSKVTSFAAAV